MNSSEVAQLEQLSEPEFAHHAVSAEISVSGSFLFFSGGILVGFKFD